MIGFAMHRTALFLAVLVLCLAGPFAHSLQAAPDERKAKQFVREGIARVVEIMKAHRQPKREIYRRLRDAVRDGFDVEGIASFALGGQRRKASDQQFKHFIREFEDLVLQTYTSRIITFGPRIKTDISDILKVTGVAPAGPDQLIVRSQVNRKGAQWVKIDWRVRERNGEIRIIDVTILGISQAQLYRAEFNSVMRRRGGIVGLISALREKNEALNMR